MYFNLALVFLLSGLWHGASWNYVIWGAFHGLFLILDRLFLKTVLDRLGQFVSIVFTFVVVMFGWVIFRLEDFGRMKAYLVKLIEFKGDSSSIDTLPAFALILVLAILFSFLVSFKVGKKLQVYFFEAESYGDKSHVFLFLLSVLLLWFSASSITSSGFDPFIYFRF